MPELDVAGLSALGFLRILLPPTIPFTILQLLLPLTRGAVSSLSSLMTPAET